MVLPSRGCDIKFFFYTKKMDASLFHGGPSKWSCIFNPNAVKHLKKNFRVHLCKYVIRDAKWTNTLCRNERNIKMQRYSCERARLYTACSKDTVSWYNRLLSFDLCLWHFRLCNSNYPDVQNHAKTRHKLPDSSAERLFESIINGDESEAELSDNEVNEVTGGDTTNVVCTKCTVLFCLFVFFYWKLKYYFREPVQMKSLFLPGARLGLRTTSELTRNRIPMNHPPKRSQLWLGPLERSTRWTHNVPTSHLMVQLRTSHCSTLCGTLRM